jgi:hypothetical protein
MFSPRKKVLTMNGSKAIVTALSTTQNLLNQYVSDLSDADLLIRPAPGANHIAWQLGHLVFAEGHLAAPQLPGTTYPAVPSDFKDRYGKEGASDDSPKNFLSKAQYLEMFNQARDITKAAVAKLSDSDLDRPSTGNLAKIAPTVGDLILLVANHTMMHAGQFTCVRRKLGKPVLM